MPYEPLGIWLIDQWRQIGLNVNQEVIEAAAYYTPLRAGDFEVAMDFQCGYIVEPDLDIYKFISNDKNPANYGRYTDRVLDDLYDKQARASRSRRAEGAAAAVREAPPRRGGPLHPDAPVAPHHPAHRARSRGGRSRPSHYLNNQLDTVWLTE